MSGSADARATLTLDRPLELKASLTLLPMGGGDPTQRLTATEYWKATRTPEGPATLHVLHAARDRVEVELWGPGAAWLLPRVPALIGERDRTDDFDPPEGRIRQLHREHRGLRLVRVPWVSELLLQVILQQKVTSVQAFDSYRALARLYGEDAPGPAGLRLPIAPRALAYLAREELARLGVDHQRSQALREASLVARRVNELVDADLTEVRRRLGCIRGVGPWTIESMALFGFGDADAVQLGDYHLPDTIAYALAGEPRADDARMLELLEPYRGHRGRVALLIEVGGPHAPRYGPRMRLPGPPRRARS